jgi:hypothetical protein
MVALLQPMTPGNTCYLVVHREQIVETINIYVLRRVVCLLHVMPGFMEQFMLPMVNLRVMLLLLVEKLVVFLLPIKHTKARWDQLMILKQQILVYYV